ncbi:FAD/NAD(P)-binding protein [Nocardia sp. NPDC003345]
MHIGIVGAGAAAVALLDALAGLDAAPGAVTVFDGSSALWRGRPYQPDLAAVRVNAPPPLMSVRAGDREHYQRWLAEQGDMTRYLDPGLGQPLVPRATYGDYLEQTARAAIARLRGRGWRVGVVNSYVTAAGRDTATVLHAADGSDHPVDRVVLCVGSGGPRDHYGLTGTPGYVNEPYPLAVTTAGIPPEAEVAVIGSGLTAVDVVAALAERGHTGPIGVHSRSGVLPYVQQRPVPLAPVRLTPAEAVRLAGAGPVTFAQLVELMRAELAEHGQDLDPLTAEIRNSDAEDPVVRLRRQLGEVDAPHLGRRLLVLAIRVLGPIVWPALAEDDRTMLRTGYFRTISSLSSPMVPHNADIVLRQLETGRLRLRSGLTKIEARPDGGFTVHDDAEWRADVVINAVNPPAYTTPAESEPLLGVLQATGQAEFARGGGVAVDPHTHQVLVGGRPDPVWYVLGNLAAASMFIATNPPGLAAEAAMLARRLVDGRGRVG